MLNYLLEESRGFIILYCTIKWIKDFSFMERKIS